MLPIAISASSRASHGDVPRIMERGLRLELSMYLCMMPSFFSLAIIIIDHHSLFAQKLNPFEVPNIIKNRTLI